MPIHAGDYHKVEAFRKLVAPDQYSATRIVVAFAAFIVDKETRLHTARVFFQTVPFAIDEFHVRTNQVFAGRFFLPNTPDAIDQFVAQVSSGLIPTPWGKLEFWSEMGLGGQFVVSFDPVHEAGLQEQRRISVLKISGGYLPPPPSFATIDWELRASETPFESLDELYAVLGLERQSGQIANVEFIAYQTVGIHFAESRLEQDQVSIVVHLSKGLSQERFSLGIRALDGTSINRVRWAADRFSWTERSDFLEGRACHPANGANAVQCFANYNDVNYGSTWLIDQSISINTRFAAFKAFDRDLETTTRELFPEPGTKERARNFEMAVGWLFWMLGFNPVALDGNFGLPDTADFLFVDELGQVIIVDCTTQRISVNDKLEKLSTRHAQLRTTLRNNRVDFVKSHAIVITRSSDEIVEADLERAERNHITVVASASLRLLYDSLRTPKRPSEILDVLLSNQTRGG